MSTLIVHTDGGARGNPGPAGIGVVFDIADWQWQHERYIGNATNNIAEYTAIADAVHHIPQVLKHQGPVESIEFYLDSELVVRQLCGQYRVKEETLQKLHRSVSEALKELGLPYKILHVRREQNKLADKLVNHALDQYLANV